METAGSTSIADDFLRNACLTYGGDWQPSLVTRARQLLEEHPGLVRVDLHTAAAAGEVAAAEEILARDPEALSRKGGALGWEPILYACYSRLDAPGRSTLEVARLLLARGADPNAGFLWEGLVPPFTALTGAFGEGEDGTNQPPHPRAEALARLLLDAGADPNDGQALYNRHFRRGDEHLRLLLAYGLGSDKGGPWYARLGDRLIRPAQLLVDELWAAARKDFRERVELLVEGGADVNGRGTRDGRTPYEAGILAGNREVAALLLRHGARPAELSAGEAFWSACVAGDAEEARRLLGEDPRLPERLGPHGRAELLHRAVEARRPDGIRLMVALGFDPNGMTRNTPLHDAAWAGDLAMVELLIELGADPTVRDPAYGGTPQDWAARNGQREVVDYLASLARR